MSESKGYVIAGPNLAGELEADWDGEVYLTPAAAAASLAQCRETYTDWGLYELIRVPDDGEEIKPHAWFTEINKAWQHSLDIRITGRDGKTHRGHVENNPHPGDFKVSIKDYSKAPHHQISNVILISDIRRIEGEFPR